MYWLYFCLVAIQFVLSDEFSHMRPEERQQLLHVSRMTSYSSYSQWRANTMKGEPFSEVPLVIREASLGMN